MVIDSTLFSHYVQYMTVPHDNRSDNEKSCRLTIRLSPSEDAVFHQAARMTGLGLSSWLRMVARREAIKVLLEAGKTAPWK